MIFLSEPDPPTALSALHRTLDLALGAALGLGLALVVKLFALTETDLDLDAAVLEVDRQRDERQPVLLDAGSELLDLAPVH